MMVSDKLFRLGACARALRLVKIFEQRGLSPREIYETINQPLWLAWLLERIGLASQEEILKSSWFYQRNTDLDKYDKNVFDDVVANQIRRHWPFDKINTNNVFWNAK
jgi:hypothetical protein